MLTAQQPQLSISRRSGERLRVNLAEQLIRPFKPRLHDGIARPCYSWDFGTGKPMPLDLMKKQCELGRQWLEQRRIVGMIFLASNVCDLELESVEWTRKWIADVGHPPS